MVAFTKLAAKNAQPLRLNQFTRRPLPRFVWALSWIAIVLTVMLAGWAMILGVHHAEVLETPKFRGVLAVILTPEKFSSVLADILMLAKFSIVLATILTLLTKTTILDRPLFGTAFLGLSSAMALGTVSVGTIVSKDIESVKSMEELGFRNTSPPHYRNSHRGLTGWCMGCPMFRTHQ